MERVGDAESEEWEDLHLLLLFDYLLLDTPGAWTHRDSLIYEPACWGRISPTTVEVNSPKALLGSRPKVPTCPAIPNPRRRIFLAALKSLSITHPHLQTCVLVDSVFFTISPHLEHSWVVYCGFTATVIFSNTLPKYSSQTRNWYQDASLIDLAKQWFFTMFLILKSTRSNYIVWWDYALPLISQHGLYAAYLFWDGVYLESA